MKCDESLGPPDNDSFYQIHDWSGTNSNPKGAAVCIVDFLLNREFVLEIIENSAKFTSLKDIIVNMWVVHCRSLKESCNKTYPGYCIKNILHLFLHIILNT